MAPIRVVSLPGMRFQQNPYIRLFCEALSGAGVDIVDLKSRKAALFRFDIVHVHFPEHYVSAQTLTGALVWVSLYSMFLLASKLLGKTIIWSVHNVEPFDDRHPWLLGPWMRLFRSLVDGTIHLSQSSRDEFRCRHPHLAAIPSCVVPHGPYRVPPPDASKEDAVRKSLTIDRSACLVGFLGNIKKYKNIEALRSLPDTLPSGRLVRIVIAGTPDYESADSLEYVAQQLGDRAVRISSRLGDEDLNTLIRAVDVVFLPYTKGWNSGFAMLVLCNRARLLTSSLPMFAELHEQVGKPWMYTYDSEAAIPEMLQRVASAPETAEARRCLEVFLENSAFEAGGRKMVEFYQQFLPDR